jgi:hypothetical protein
MASEAFTGKRRQFFLEWDVQCVVMGCKWRAPSVLKAISSATIPGRSGCLRGRGC